MVGCFVLARPRHVHRDRIRGSFAKLRHSGLGDEQSGDATRQNYGSGGQTKSVCLVCGLGSLCVAADWRILVDCHVDQTCSTQSFLSY
jgi:hypothetical protein